MIIGYAAALILLLTALAGITLEKAYFYLPGRELKRRADKGDAIARDLLKPATYGDEARLLLVFASWLLAAASVVLLVRLAPLALGVMGAIATLLLAFFWQVRSPLTAQGARFAARCAPPLTITLHRIHPLLVRPAKLFQRLHLQRSHTGLYESDDLIDFLDRQKRQHDNRIGERDLQRLQRVLAIRDRSVGELMTPTAKVRSVDAAELISPVLQNELHRTGHRVFPVFHDKRTNLIGLLRLSDVADIKQHGTVGDAAYRQLAYINQSDTLESAVRAFYETHQQLLIVLDNHGIWVGILALNDILVHVFGKLDHLAYGHFDDPDAVANKVVAKD